MGRIRTIKPEFPQSESMGRISRDARLLFILLWTIADDSGRTRAASRMLASLLYPYDDDAPAMIDGWLDELEREGCIVRYQHDGGIYLQVCKWLNHQKIDRPTPSRLPEFDESSRALANPRESSTTDLGPRTLDRGPRTLDQGPKKARVRASLPQRPTDVREQVWTDWLALRAAKRAPVTETVLRRAREEASKAGLTMDAFLETWCARGSQGLEAAWLMNARKAPVKDWDDMTAAEFMAAYGKGREEI